MSAGDVTARSDGAAAYGAREVSLAPQVERLIARAAKVGAWGQAEEYCRSRFNGPKLAYALAELGHAKEEARNKKTERQAA